MIHAEPLERGQGLLWILIAAIICAALVVALILSPEQHAGSTVDRSILGLQHKKPPPCRSAGEANCVPIKP